MQAAAKCLERASQRWCCSTQPNGFRYQTHVHVLAVQGDKVASAQLSTDLPFSAESDAASAYK
jgi:hypothetical protein